MSIDNFIATCTELASKHFQISSLRPAQKIVLESIYVNQGVLATLPTGAGKTLIYALWALVYSDKPVLVVCPLISLMRDQYRRMQAAGIDCAIFTSEQTPDERSNSYKLLQTKKAKIIFASPERMVIPSFNALIMKQNVSLAVIDEAHCIIQWGPSFRPEYAQMGQVLARIYPEKIIALTATASKGSRKIIGESVFPESFSFKEIAFPPIGTNIAVKAIRVHSEQEKWLNLMANLRNINYKKAICYFPKRDACDTSALALRKAGIHAISYHAGLTREERLSAENYIHATQAKIVICATQAFGMGVDLTGVKLVIVYGFPSGIEEFLQMIGRAGRGGEFAKGLLLWSGADPKKREFQFEESYPSLEKMRLYLNDIGNAFPGEWQKRWISQGQLENYFRLTPKDITRKFPGIIAALRILGSIELVNEHEKYLQITFLNGFNPTKIMLELPQETTRRSRFFEALFSLTYEKWRKLPDSENIFQISHICEETGFFWERCQEILDFYRDKKCLEYKVLDSSKTSYGYFICNSLGQATQKLVHYAKIRKEYKASLVELTRLAVAQRCRLTVVDDYFAPHTFDGIKHISPRRCNQCDLCLTSFDNMETMF